MNTNLSYGLGMLVGLLVALVLAKLLAKYYHTDGQKKSNYDERQKLLIGKGYKYAFSTLIVYNCLYVVLYAMTGKAFFDIPTAAFMNIFIGVAVFAVYCIWKEAYFSLNDNYRKYIILITILMLINAAGGLGIARHETLIENGMLTYRSLNLLCALLILIILTALLIKKIVSRNTDIEDD